MSHSHGRDNPGDNAAIIGTAVQAGEEIVDYINQRHEDEFGTHANDLAKRNVAKATAIASAD